MVKNLWFSQLKSKLKDLILAFIYFFIHLAWFVLGLSKMFERWLIFSWTASNRVTLAYWPLSDGRSWEKLNLSHTWIRKCIGRDSFRLNNSSARTPHVQGDGNIRWHKHAITLVTHCVIWVPIYIKAQRCLTNNPNSFLKAITPELLLTENMYAFCDKYSGESFIRRRRNHRNTSYKR